ncbi:uncharacterized protein LOC108817190 [Raphanus sativus]|uniref:Uncharacterized protein LOC108817190 n=1 Tax=Raphanus sativus TaxID=3726 RepID=A0A6J0KAT9_RAPSA|nr:uncharacterized protein LOC108817190 [Raphanus sativus]
MKRFERPRTSTTSKPRTSSTLAKKDQKQQPTSKANGGVKPLNAAQLVSRVLDATASDPSSVTLNDSTTGSESSEVYENMNLHYMDDANEKPRNDETLMMVDYGDESGTETNNDSVSSSQGGDVFSPEDKKSSRVPKSRSSQDIPLTSKGRASVGSVRSRSSTFHRTARKTVRSSKSHQAKALSDLSSYRSSSETKKTFSPETVDDASFEDAKEDDKFEDALNNSTDSDNDNDNEVVHVDKEGERNQDLTQKIGTLESRIERLEEELREVATLEMSLYSVFPEHGSSEHELHRPARDLSRIYALARKNQSENKLISVAKNIVSGLYLVLKSCGSDVLRLTFWLSNTVMLREIISHEFGGTNINGSNWLEEDWTDIRTLIAALRRVESCLFTSTVGSIWSQVMMVHMRSPQGVGSTKCEMMGNFSEPSTCDRLQESFSLNLWKKAFEEALQRLCPVVQAERCGCLHVLTRMVMEQCIARLDVAMFNAILRESAQPTDSDSDPISDPRVLPIPAGVLSFESGVKLKNTVGYWSRLLTDIFEIDDDHSEERGDETFKPFHLLNELSDLLMLPKEMLVDSSTRDEVCPSIGLSLIKRILCNFTPDEFCPYPVPGTVLEELNAQSIIERRSSSSGDATRDFPRQVDPVEYCLPSSPQLTDMVEEFSDNLKVSMIQNIVYNNNEEVDTTSRSPPYYKIIKGVEEKDNLSFSPTNERYRLLGEI